MLSGMFELPAFCSLKTWKDQVNTSTITDGTDGDITTSTVASNSNGNKNMIDDDDDDDGDGDDDMGIETIAAEETTDSSSSNSSNNAIINERSVLVLNSDKTKTTKKKAGPWVDMDRSQSDPLPLVSDFDTRPSTRDLIQQYKEQIQQVQRAFEQQQQKQQQLESSTAASESDSASSKSSSSKSKSPKSKTSKSKSKASESCMNYYYDPVRHDELWILRYLLSQKTVPKAVEAATKFMQYRQELKLDDKDIRRAPPGGRRPSTTDSSAAAADNNDEDKDEANDNDNADTTTTTPIGVSKFFDCLEDDGMTFALPDDHRGIVIFAHLSGFRQAELMEKIPLEQEWPFWYFMEWSFQVLDSITRATGRLTKGIRIVDLEGYTLSQNHKALLDRASKNAKGVQDQYPQLLASVFIVNAPSYFTWGFTLLKPLMPRRFCEKFDILSKQNATKGLLQHMSLEHIPEKYGGTMTQWPYPIAGTAATAAAADDE
eukprot:CAMPEP_0198142836 /NCGR_PEP_ID=MMETSP1443-20131203/5520_1 /TAXON_ID=186043 /ORGANISM="Entomoneis sp., Strain CCMP2396" /LENGTH=486 /DNA_ID=CAMNT_0043805939 /DNA_START=86 /DNA_END=1546 /DNA_ORIENTATION=+